AVYNDFFGYTSIMRGISGLFGIQLSPNFNLPFAAGNLSEFWMRWHITLSNWLRDYVFLPLSRTLLKRNHDHRSLIVIATPILVTMLASGVWHGLGWNYLLWGLVLGLPQAVDRSAAMRLLSPGPMSRTLLSIFSSICLLVAAVLFNSSVAEALTYLHTLAAKTLFSPSTDVHYGAVLSAGILIIISRIVDKAGTPGGEQLTMRAIPSVCRTAAWCAVLLLILVTSQADSQTPFVYQEF
ncbi:MAG: hypothetical protein KDA89_19270, partial [Planctomycetaceae bacterium]|nr:hypothetical protein [Planctomycetaceae bacterium]